MKLLPLVLKKGIAVVVVIICCSALPAAAGNASGMVSLADVNSTLRSMEKGFADMKEKNQLSFELQKGLVVRSGECVTRLVELSQKADIAQAAVRQEFKALFLKNGELLRGVIAYNQGRIDDAMEQNHSAAADKETAVAPGEWQQAQYLTLLAGYWLGWNSYYAALLCEERAAARAELLEEAVSGFTRAGINFQDPSLAGRCILGRALCFKELKEYDKALEDLQAVMKRVSRDDPLYAQAGYEKALISYLTGKKDHAVQQIQELEAAVNQKSLPQHIKEKLNNLQTTIALGIAKKKSAPHDNATKQSEREAVQELRRIAYADGSQADVLYRYVLEHAAALAAVPDAELGSMGTLAVADWYFDRKQYDLAIERYRRLYSAPDTLIKRHMDDVCFRLAYALAQRQQWQDAVSCLETLFAKSPKTSYGGKAACLYYVAAVHVYKEKPNEAAYSRYIKAAERYVKNCPDAQDKSEAHFQLGLYYQHKGRTPEALKEFALVKSDSPHYAEAHRAGVLSSIDTLQAHIEQIEALVRQGKGQSDEAKRLYHEALKQADGWQKKSGTKDSAAGSEADARMAYLLARLYMHGPEPSPHKALQLLQGFEKKYSVTQQRQLLFSLAAKLRLECYLQLHRLYDAEQEINSIAEAGPIDQDTLEFLTDCADRYYRQAQGATGNNETARAAQREQTAIAIYKKLAGIAADKKLYDHLQMRLAELYTNNNQPEHAAAIYRKKLEQDPTSADAIYKLGCIYDKQARWQDAFDTWRKLSQGLKQGTPPWFEARYREAWSLAQLGKQADACQVIAVTRLRFQDFGGGAYRQKFIQLHDEVCGRDTAVLQSNHAKTGAGTAGR